MSIKALQDYTYYSKYARYNKKAKRRETWGEAIDRVKNMHLVKYADQIKRHPELSEQIEWAFDVSRQKRVLGSQRALQFGGEPILSKHARIYNCCTSYCDRIRFFQESFWLLLCGCGVGFSVQKHHIARLPDFTDKVSVEGGGVRFRGVKKFLIHDSIEGWADALGVLLASYFPFGEFPDYEGYHVEFDYTLIRKEGSPISSGTGRAPGPEPLRRSLELVRNLLNTCLLRGQTRLRPIDCYDIVMHTSDAVLSGGVRRSASICMFSPDDEEMATAKTGNWFVENPQRGRSNNSALLLRDETTKEQFLKLMESVKEFGEPGFIWADSTESTYNPCVEINLYPRCIETGESGWAFCVSGDTNLLTRSGKERIVDCVGKEVDVWNGTAWKTVKPFQTGSNRTLYRVHLGDGSFLDCTDNHKWLVKDRFMDDYEDVETKDLMSFSKYVLHTPPPEVQWQGDIANHHAYEHGFILGDGCAKRTDALKQSRTPVARLFGGDKQVGLECKTSHEGVNVYGTPFQAVSFPQLDENFCWRMKYDDGLPSEVFTWDRQSAYAFIAGWADADGSVAGRGFRIYGRRDKLVDLQLLLTKLGFYSSLNLMEEEGEETNFGVRKNGVWYVQCRRLHIRQSDRNSAGKGMRQTIRYVEKLPGTHDTFCVYEPETNRCLFNNVLTKQCNLCEINGKKIKSVKDWSIAARAGAIIGTLQAGYTDFDYLGDVTKRIVEREALLGVSITGMMDNPDIIFQPELQRQMARLVVETNEEIVKLIGINPAARVTCTKPAGTTSCVLGTGSGIHPHHAKRYLRRIQGNQLEAPLQWFKKYNPSAVERSVWSANGTDEVINFCVEVPDGAKTKNDLDAITLLRHVMLTQQNWVTYGCVKERCTQSWLMHNVSNTINVRPEEWDSVAEFIYDNRRHFAGISLLPISGDKDFPQAPMCAVYTPKEIVSAYGDGSLLASGLIVDSLKAYDNNLWKACEAVLGTGEAMQAPKKPTTTNIVDHINYERDRQVYDDKIEWLRRATQFAERYFDDDIRKMTYCLKDVNNWKVWLDLKREYTDVDYTIMFEDEDNTKVQQEWACSGGACQMI